MAKSTTASGVIAIIRAELERHRAETKDKHPDPKAAPALFWTGTDAPEATTARVAARRRVRTLSATVAVAGPCAGAAPVAGSSCSVWPFETVASVGGCGAGAGVMGTVPKSPIRPIQKSCQPERKAGSLTAPRQIARQSRAAGRDCRDRCCQT